MIGSLRLLPGRQESLSLFAPTADQRLLVDGELFWRTHFPMTFRRYRQPDEWQPVAESELAHHLLSSNASGTVGNRVWMLYGVPGSGKSETLRWLESYLVRAEPWRQTSIVRISRNDMGFLPLLEKLHPLLPSGFWGDALSQRWQQARQKPRTLAKLLLLFALETMLDSDEQINPLFYRLLHTLQPQLEQRLAPDPTQHDAPLDLISLETWTSILGEMTLPVTLDYNQFSQRLLGGLRHHLLEGLSFRVVLKQISHYLYQTTGHRPLLLIDDLVQALHLFATEWLDYLLTPEEGQWDVVVGLTPDAFEKSQRGRLLLQRLHSLDTVDDRVTKLWLSDEGGNDSYLLDEATCVDFASAYLSEFHRLNHWEECPSLYPFNPESLVRIYRALPSGKGKVRHFVRALHDILDGALAGQPILEAIQPLARPESVARCADRHIALLCEYYGPLVREAEVRQVTLPVSLLQQFGILAHQASTIPIEPLFKGVLPPHSPPSQEADASKIAVREWLLGRSVNRQSLVSLRRGAARWLTTLLPVGQLYRPHIARPHGVLRWHRPYLRTAPAICLEGVDDEGVGLLLSRQVGEAAFDLLSCATARGSTLQHLVESLLTNPAMSALLWAGHAQQRQLVWKLGQQLGMEIEQAALLLYLCAVVHDGLPRQRPPGLERLWPDLQRAHHQVTVSGFTQAIATQPLYFLFEDFFRLRENLYDGPSLAQRLTSFSLDEGWAALVAMRTEEIAPAYRLANVPLGHVLHTLQQWLRAWQQAEPETNPITLAHQLISQLQHLRSIPLAPVSPATWAEVARLRPDLYAALRISLDEPR